MALENIKQTVTVPIGFFLPQSATQVEISDLMMKYKLSQDQDEVKVTASLGSILYDILSSQTPSVDKPPFKAALYKNWLSDLASRVSKKKIKLMDKEMASLKEILDNEIKWNGIKAFVEVNSEDNVIEVNSHGISLFTDVLSELTSIFL